MEKKRGYIFVWNNYTEDSVRIIRSYMEQVEYGIFGYEVGDLCGTPHLQGYVYFKNARGIKGVVKALKGAHVEGAKGDSLSNQKYSSKSGKFEEFGKLPEQGKRNDLIEIRNRILAGERVDNLAMENPMRYHMYGRTMNYIEDIVLRKKSRKWETKGWWLYGPTYTGKSERAFADFDPDTHYNLMDDHGWWDGYTGQETVIINDFRGEIPYNKLLQMLDKYPFNVNRRGRPPAPFLAKLVIFTSSLSMEQVYHHRDEEDSIQQLLRRCKQTYTGTEVVGGNNKTPTIEEFMYNK